MARSGGEQSNAATPENVSDLFRALSNRYRREAVRALDETHTPVTRTALATYVAKEVLPPSQRSDFVAFRDRVVVQLRHVHLPALEAAGIVEIESGKITLGPTFPAAVALVEDVS